MTVAARSAEEHPARNEPRARRWRPRVLLGVVVLLWAGLMFPLAFWGLPTAHNDDLLFGGTAPWPADRYGLGQALAERQSRRAGADTDLNPLAERERVVDLTADEAARAEILRRYRLFSGQPDEMITLMALQRMRPRAGDFDPQMYQYGGAYIYMVGAVLGGARLVGIIPRGADAGFYLEHPDVFGRFYVVARCLSLVFAALALVAVYHLGQRAGGATTGWLALALAAGAPVFITQALEAKPHLPSACLILWAILSALDYRATGRTRDALKMGAQAGFACGLVLTGVVAALLWPALLLARPGHARRAALRDLGLAAAVAAAVYAATNPFLVRNLLFARGALESNIANSTAMYANQISRAGEGLFRVAQLLPEAAGVLTPILGLAGAIFLARRRPNPSGVAAASGLGMLVICIMLGAGKPAEFGRFLILPAILLAAAAAWALVEALRRHPLSGVPLAVLTFALLGAPAYLRAFAADARGTDETRRAAGEVLAELREPGDAIGVLQEPAPYAVPPLDFASARVLLLPARRPTDLAPADLPEWLVFTADNAGVHARDWWQPEYELIGRFPPDGRPHAPVAWAHKPVFVYRRR